MAKVRTRRLLIALILSYLTIFCIPTLTILALNRQSRAIIEAEVGRSTTAILTQLRQSIDTRLSDIFLQAYQIGNGPTVESCMFMKREFSAGDYYNIYRLRRELLNYRATNSYIKEYCVYFNRSDMLVSSASSFSDSMRLAYDVVMSGASVSYEEWHASLNERHTKHFVPIYTPEGDLWSVAYYQSFHIQTSPEYRVTVALYIDPKLFKDLIRDVSLADGAALTIIADEAGAFYSTDMPLGSRLNEYGDLIAQSEMRKIDIDGEEYGVNCAQSGYNDWTYVLSLPMREYLKESAYLRRMALLAVAACTTLGLVATAIFSWSNYHPIADLTKKVSSMSDVPQAGGLDEIRYIDRALSLMMAEKETMSAQILGQKAALREHLTLKLL